MQDDSPLEALPEYLREDPLCRMRAYRLAVKLQAESWEDAEVLRRNAITEETAGQLYSAIGSIAANLGEGYSRSSGKDRVRIFEYALGSARESIAWYTSGMPVLGEELTTRRCKVLREIRRLLLAAIPEERNRLIRRAPQ